MRREGALVFFLLLIFAGFAVGCSSREEGEPEAAAPAEDDVAYRREIEAWRAERVERLEAEGGWLSLAGLHWLPEGESSVGSEPVADVVLPASAPARVGTVVRDGDVVRLAVAPGVEARHQGEPVRRLVMVSDAAAGEGEPTVVELGTLTLQVIERGERVGLRVKDGEAPSRTGFTGIESYPIDPRWRLAARFEPYDPPREIEVDDYAGGTQPSMVAGAVVFEVDGQTHRLDALDAGDDLFLIFADRTSGDTTYGGGRYLYAGKPAPGEPAIVDFNRAYNPPCVFTPYATCPLPPPQNRLDIPIEAGEKTYRSPTDH